MNNKTPDPSQSQEEEVDAHLDSINEVKKKVKQESKKLDDNYSAIKKIQDDYEQNIISNHNRYWRAEEILQRLWLYKKVYKPYLPFVFWLLLSSAALFQWGNPIDSIKKLKNSDTERSWRWIWHNATITNKIPEKISTIELQQVFGGSKFDQLWSINPEEEKKIIFDLKNQLDKITWTTITHHLGWLMSVVWKLSNSNPTLFSSYEIPTITIEKITWMSSNEDATWLNINNSNNSTLAEDRANRIKKLIEENVKSTLSSDDYSLNIESINIDNKSIDFLSKEISTLEQIAWWGNNEEERKNNIISLLQKYNQWKLSWDLFKSVDEIVWSKRNVEITIKTNEYENIEVFTFDYGLTIWYCLIAWLFFHLFPRDRKNWIKINEIVEWIDKWESEEEIIKKLEAKYKK